MFASAAFQLAQRSLRLRLCVNLCCTYHSSMLFVLACHSGFSACLRLLVLVRLLCARFLVTVVRLTFSSRCRLCVCCIAEEIANIFSSTHTIQLQRSWQHEVHRDAACVCCKAEEVINIVCNTNTIQLRQGRQHVLEHAQLPQY